MGSYDHQPIAATSLCHFSHYDENRFNSNDEYNKRHENTCDRSIVFKPNVSTCGFEFSNPHLVWTENMQQPTCIPIETTDLLAKIHRSTDYFNISRFRIYLFHGRLHFITVPRC